MISVNPFADLTNVTNENVSDTQKYEPNVFYTITEVLVSLFAIVGNSLVITVFCKERRLRRRTNYYIVSLATADLLVGLLGIPFALLASVGLPTNLHACLFTVSLLVVLCTISIFCLVAVSVDRYWAILHPMGYSRHVRTKTALVIISICWFAGCFIGFLPLMGWHQGVQNDFQCFFLKVMDYNYLVFLYFVTIITPALVLAAFYAHIYRVVLKQLRQIVTMNPENGTTTTGRTSGGTMLRMLGAAQKREVKATQNLSIIVLFFMICWIPLYTINFILAFCKECFEVNSTFMLFCIILSHLNSAGNPLLYAYHLRDFRAALKYFLLNMLGLTDSSAPTPGLNGRPSLASNLGSQNHFTHHRLQSLRESRSVMVLSQQSKYLSESQMSLNNRLTNKSYSLPNTPKISSIVTQTATLAAAPTGETAREIWRISEVPSVSASDEHSRDRETPYHEYNKNKALNRAFLTRSTSDSSGRVNNGYVDGPLELDEGDDDVFLDDFVPSMNVSYEDGLPNSSSDSINTNSEQADVTTALNKLRTKCLSSSSPQLTRGLFLVEAEINKETHPNKFVRSGSVVERDEKKTNKTFSFSGDFLHSPVKSLKLSPLKAVGEFLLHHGAKKRAKSITKLNLSEDDSAISEQYSRKENSIGVN